MANFAFNGYDNFVLENKITDTLSTKLDVNKFMTADYELAENPGMTKKIHRYTGTGEAEVLERGDGNTTFIDAGYTEEAYTVKRTQAHTRWYDEDLMNDPVLIDTKLEQLTNSMVNAWTAEAIKEFDKSENMVAVTGYTLESFADVIAAYTNKYETQEGLFFLVNIKEVPKIRKMLGDSLQYTEGYIRTGAIGAVLGVPIYTSKALPEGIGFAATSDAVHAFIKADTSVEQDRDIDTKQVDVVAAKYAVIALVDESKCVKFGKAQDTAATITTASSTTVAGAANTGAKVRAYVNGVAAGTEVTASSSTYSITVDTLATGDVVKVVAKMDGKLPSIAVVTVA